MKKLTKEQLEERVKEEIARRYKNWIVMKTKILEEIEDEVKIEALIASVKIEEKKWNGETFENETSVLRHWVHTRLKKNGKYIETVRIPKEEATIKSLD